MKRKTGDVDNSLLFLQFIKSYGFDPSKYNNILELYQSPQTSMSQYLKDYKQFLLSDKIKEKELDRIGINGAYGYIEMNTIVMPNNEIKVPLLNDFDVMAVTFDGSYIATRYASYLEILILINL